MNLSDKAIRRIAQSYWDDPEPNDFLDSFDSSKLSDLSSMAKNAYEYYWELYEAKEDGHNITGELDKLETMIDEIIGFATKLKER